MTTVALGADQDREEQILEQVRIALDENRCVDIIGSGSKRFYGRAVSAIPLPVSGHSGILSYEPSELVLTARCGTPLAVVEAALAAQGQMLAFEPPHFGGAATLGGAVATGLSGPRRPYAGSVRDCVLGVKLLNGKAEILTFGGQVMKNVAGFDVSRLMVGALGTLGVLLEISLKVLPKPEREASLVFEQDIASALFSMNDWVSRGWPLSAACHDGEHLYLRVSGVDAAVNETRRALGGEVMEDGERFWEDLREQRLAFFQGAGNLWRLSMAPAAPMPALPGDWLVDWGGALRWLRSEVEADHVFAGAREAGGHATRFRGPVANGPVFQPLPVALQSVHRQLKRAFDPRGVFNPGRMYEEW